MHYAVVDLEMCTVPKAARTSKYHWSQETIQIGAVLLDDAYEVIDKFCTYVCPEKGHITSFIRKMTGISDEHVKDAPVMQDALKLLTDWLPKEVELVAWSDSDRTQIAHEIRGKGLQCDREELLTTAWTDCQAIFDKKLKATRAYSLEQALNLSDIMYEDGAHDGLVDAYNTALLFAKLKKTPDYELNQYYKSADEKEVDHLSCTLEDLFKGIQLDS